MRHFCLSVASLLLFACSSTPSQTTATSDSGATVDAGADDSSVPVGNVVEHGIIVDYFTQKPLPGLMVADNNLTATTDADGKWSLTVPSNALLQPTVTGPKMSKVYFPDSTPATPDADVDFGTTVGADSSTYNLEQNAVDGFDPTKALVHVVMILTGSCTSVVGATASVVSPSGASLEYFATAGIPQSELTSFQDVKPNRPSFVVYNIPPGESPVVTVSHPTCKQVAFPATYAGKIYSGHVRTEGAEPADVSGALVILME